MLDKNPSIQPLTVCSCEALKLKSKIGDESMGERMVEAGQGHDARAMKERS